MTAVFAIIRALHFSSLAFLFGGALLEIQWRKAIPGLALDLRAGRNLSAAVAILTAILWLFLATMQMGGQMPDLQTIGTVLTATRFGMAFLVRAACLLLLLGTCLWNGDRRWIAILAAVALATIALIGHAAASGPPHFGFVGAINDVIHLLTASFWIGALFALVALLAGDRVSFYPALDIFSRWGMVAVSLLVMTGIVNTATILLSGGPANETYLLLLCVKIALALGMIGLAIFNRLYLMPRQQAALLRRSTIAELALGLTILLLVGFLGLLSPML